MSLPQIIEVVVGLVLVYYILGLIVSFISSRVLEALETRGKDLEVLLEKIVGDSLSDLMKQPQIKSLAPIRYDGLTGVITGRTKEMKIERISVSNLVDAVFDMYGLIGESYPDQELKSLLAKQPESEAKASLLKLVDQGVTNISQLRAKTAMSFSGLLDQATATYKAHARQFVIGFSLLITLLVGVDSIEFSLQLWQNADLRTIANTRAELYLQEEGATADIGPLVKELEELSLQIGWWAEPANIPQSVKPMDRVIWVLMKVVGLGITVLAVSQGSSFWYDVLRRLKGDNTAPADRSKNGDSAAAK